MTANFISGTEAVAGWRDGVLSGVAPVLYDVGGPGWSAVEIGPGLITLLGGAPGAGKTALAAQLTFEAVERTPELRAVIANVEMTHTVLLDRQLARMTGLSATDIRFRRFDTNAGIVKIGLEKVGAIAERIAFLKPPFSLENVAATADDFEADLLVLDYIQRFAAPGKHSSPREAMTAIMAYIREFAAAGKAIGIVSAVARGRSEKGSTYERDSLSLASFRESSELEFGADSAWLLAEDNKGTHLTCLKNRHGHAADLCVHFDKPRQTFEIISESFTGEPSRPKNVKPKRLTRQELREKARDAWNADVPFDDGGDL